MKRKWIPASALTLFFMLVLAVGLSQAQQQCPDTYEPNDSFTDAWFLSSGTITSYICCDGSDMDYFKFSANISDLIHLDLYGLPADYNLCLYDPSQNWITCSQNSGTTAETIEETATTSGDHYALVYGNQGACDSDNPYTLSITVTAAPKPDLIVTDIWTDESGQVCYQIRNVGEITAPLGHHTALSIDGQQVDTDLINEDLATGERLNRCFSYAWQCSGAEDAINVCADFQSFVIESDETNNCFSETWKCDTTPPTIVAGPAASGILSTSVVITWTTDEDSNSVVKFGRYAGVYEGQESEATLTRNHQITLTGLTPSTVYHYVVESTDAASNTVTSGEGFFETAPPPDSEPPTIHGVTVTVGSGPVEYYVIDASVSDNEGVERVEFYLDDDLIAVDYSASSPYRSYMVPARLAGMTRAKFFVTHTMTIRAFDRSGLSASSTFVYEPDFETADVDLRIFSPHPDLTFYLDVGESGLPAGTTVDIEVYAAENEWRCTWFGGSELPPGVSPVRCGDVAHEVSRVEFYIDGALEHTVYPAADDFYHSYTWDASGLRTGSYEIQVRAIASDGSIHVDRRTVTVARGTPSLNVSREVSRIDNYFRVRLTVENEGTATTAVGYIEDNLAGFQPIITSTAYYSVIPRYGTLTRRCHVEIDVFTDTAEAILLPPGGSMTVEYLAVPILYADSDTFEYGFGAEEVLIYDADGICRWRLDRPTDVTPDGELLAQAVVRAKESSDYLIVTNPRRLFIHDMNYDDFNELLSKMAELARLKTGILGYLSVHKAREIRDQVKTWGRGMKGSDGIADHYLSNGYLLLVGEVEALGSWETKHKLWIDGKRRTRTVHYTDLPYGNTSGSWVDPELIVGRVIGNSSRELMIPLQTSINVHRGEPNYLFTKSRALLVSGRGDGVTEFESNVDDIAGTLQRPGSDFSTVEVKKQKTVEDDEGLDITWVFTSSVYSGGLGQDLIFYRDHCGPYGWGDGKTVIDTGHFPIDLGIRRPFVFACCCQAGRYEALGATSIAEAFLQNETGVYIGSTENSFRSSNSDAASWFFQRWADSAESVGQSFKALKVHLSDDEGDYWAAEYNLYGDPKYGARPTTTALASPVETAATAPITSVAVTVPDYEVTTAGPGEHYVQIPSENGSLLIEDGKPIVPVFYKEIDYASGYRVQDVVLTARSGLTTATGLSITVTSLATDSVASASVSSSSDGDEWWPALTQTFDWTIREHPDGSSTLVIRMYPFYYNSQTTNVKFYQNYSFTIQVISSTVEIESLTTDKNAYSQGDEVLVDLWLNNSGTEQDVIVNAVVRAEDSGEVVDGLLLRSLKGLTGTASFSPRWDSTGFAPGYYRIEAEVRDTAGHVLDRRMEQFRLGICSGEVTIFTATPTFFDPGETITISMAFSNTGTVPITGTAIVEIQDESGKLVREFNHAVENLPPGNSVAWADSWDTTGAGEGAYHLVGYVLYDSQATELKAVTVSTETYVYLPLILKDSPSATR